MATNQMRECAANVYLPCHMAPKEDGWYRLITHQHRIYITVVVWNSIYLWGAWGTPISSQLISIKNGLFT